MCVRACVRACVFVCVYVNCVCVRACVCACVICDVLQTVGISQNAPVFQNPSRVWRAFSEEKKEI